jgi:hypothetical protein
MAASLKQFLGKEPVPILSSLASCRALYARGQESTGASNGAENRLCHLPQTRSS